MVRSMFNTGGGKAVSISEEGLAKARREMQAIVPTTQGVRGVVLSLALQTAFEFPPINFLTLFLTHTQLLR